jgi:hypothetical protein
MSDYAFILNQKASWVEILEDLHMFLSALRQRAIQPDGLFIALSFL